MSVGRAQSRWELLTYWLFFSVLVSLAGVWVVALVGVLVGKPAYEAPLHDGTLYAYAIVLVAVSFGSFFRDILQAVRSGVPAPSPILAGLFALAGAVLLGGGAVVMYTVKALDLVEEVTVRRELEPWLGAGVAFSAIIYGLACEAWRRPLNLPL